MVFKIATQSREIDSAGSFPSPIDLPIDISQEQHVWKRALGHRTTSKYLCSMIPDILGASSGDVDLDPSKVSKEDLEDSPHRKKINNLWRLFLKGEISVLG